jgi:hypothetical protein
MDSLQKREKKRIASILSVAFMAFESSLRSGIDSLGLWTNVSTNNRLASGDSPIRHHGNAIATHSDRMYILNAFQGVTAVNLSPADPSVPIFSKVCIFYPRATF